MRCYNDQSNGTHLIYIHPKYVLNIFFGKEGVSGFPVAILPFFFRAITFFWTFPFAIHKKNAKTTENVI